MDLNNRDIAVLVWLALAAILLSLKADIRDAFKDVVRAFLDRRIILILATAAIYVALCVLLLSKLNAWQWSNLKTTLVWALTFGFVSLIEVVRIDEDSTYFRKVLRDALAGTAIVTFIAEFYTFNLLAELFLVPVISIVTIMQATASFRPEHARVGKLLGNVLTGIGLFIFFYAAYRTVVEFSDFATFETVREFMIPILLTILFIPFAYLFATYVIYQALFIRTDWVIEDPELRKYAKLQAILAFHINHDFMRRWARAMKLTCPQNKADVRRIIRELKYRKRRESNPPQIPATSGWPPHVAKSFFSEEGITTNDYHQDIIEWNAESKPIKINDAILSDTVSYYVVGDSISVKRLKLRLSANGWNDTRKSDQRFYELCDALLEKALGEEIAGDLKASLRNSDTLSIKANGKHIVLANYKYPSGRTYHRTLSVEII